VSILFARKYPPGENYEVIYTQILRLITGC